MPAAQRDWVYVPGLTDRTDLVGIRACGRGRLLCHPHSEPPLAPVLASPLQPPLSCSVMRGVRGAVEDHVAILTRRLAPLIEDPVTILPRQRPPRPKAL